MRGSGSHRASASSQLRWLSPAAFQQCQNPDAEGTDEEPRSALQAPAAAGAPPRLAPFTTAWFALQGEASVLDCPGDSAGQDWCRFLGRGHYWGAKNTFFSQTPPRAGGPGSQSKSVCHHSPCTALFSHLQRLLKNTGLLD